jgi:hypothetical protein
MTEVMPITLIILKMLVLMQITITLGIQAM